MAAEGLALLTAIGLIGNQPALEYKNINVHQGTVQVAAEDAEKNKIPDACLDPESAVQGCALAGQLYYQSKEWEKRARKTFADLEGCTNKLRKAEDALLRKTETSEPAGWTFSPGIVIGGITVAVGTTAVLTYLLTR